MSAPELSDELATELGYESTDDMRSKVAADIASSKEENLKNQARVQILQHLVENNEFEVPQAMVEEQFRALTNELRMQQMYMGRNPDDVQLLKRNVVICLHVQYSQQRLHVCSVL